MLISAERNGVSFRGAMMMRIQGTRTQLEDCVGVGR